MPRPERDRFRLRCALERGPLGGISTPETGFVWDVVRIVWDLLTTADKLSLFLASWPHTRERWTILLKFTQGKRVEYGLPGAYAFGGCSATTLTCVGLGHVIDLDYWLVLDDTENLGKLFRLLKKYGGLPDKEAVHGSKTVGSWRGELIRIL